MIRMDEMTERQLLGMEGAAEYLGARERRRVPAEWVAVLTALACLNVALLLLILR